MALSKEQKQAQVKDLTEKMSSATSIILAHYIGLSVTEVSELRRTLRESEAEMKVAKKTLIQIATKEAGLPAFEGESMEGPVSLIFSFGDPLSGAQIAFTFGKDHRQVQILGGVYDGKILSKEEAVELAKMPSRDVLLATFVDMLRSPLASFASMCNTPLSGFARGMQELAGKGGVHPEADASPAKEEESDTPPTGGEDAEKETEDEEKEKKEKTNGSENNSDEEEQEASSAGTSARGEEKEKPSEPENTDS